MEGSGYELEGEPDQCGEQRRHNRRGEGRQKGLGARLERRLVMILDSWQVPGAKPASSMTRRPVKGGGEVAMKVGGDSLLGVFTGSSILDSGTRLRKGT